MTSASDRRFVALQPVLTLEQQVHGYELSFRAGVDQALGFHDGDLASSAAVDSLLTLGLQNLTGGRKAFIPCTRTLLANNILNLLPPDCVVLEIDTDCLSDDLSEKISHLSSHGYSFAWNLKDAANPAHEVLRRMSFSRIDSSLPRARQVALLKTASEIGTPAIAINVDTHEQFRSCCDLGFSYVQGYFFCRPKLVSQSDIPVNKLICLRLLGLVNEREFDLQRIDDELRCETSLCYRLLRCLNSPAFGFRSEIRSIRHALTLMGETQFRRWLMVATIGTAGADKPSEIMLLALIRARFCELVAQRIAMAGRAADFFLAGLFSLLDAVLGRPMSQILSDLPVSNDIKTALTTGGNKMHQAISMTRAHERADWTSFCSTARTLNISDEEAAELYVSAVDWARRVHAVA